MARARAERSLSPDDLYASLGLPAAPTIVDVRHEDEVRDRPRLLPCARRGEPERIAEWSRALPRSRPIAVYCERGDTTSPNLAETLVALGHEATFLEGGLERWQSEGRATARARSDLGVPGGSRWIPRARPKVDRLACPWLVRRFLDPEALFFYAPAHLVRSEAASLRAQPYDIADVTFSHRGERCSFDAFLEEFDLHDPVLDAVAEIVRAADTGDLAASPQAPGLLAFSLGLSANIADDMLLLEQAMPLYDALYAWCKVAREEAHSWPKAGSPG
jgi:rhodanese-related sulfurtransferase